MGKLTSTQSMNSSGHSGEDFLERVRFGVFGPPGSGKTTVAASMSKYWKGPTKQKKITHLSDLYWLSVDQNATACLEALGYRVNEIRLTDGLMRKPKPGEKKDYIAHPLLAYREMLKRAYMAIKEGAETIVLDTWSELNATYKAYILDKMGTEDLSIDNRPLYGTLGDWEEAGLRKLLELPCHIIFLCHIKEHIDYGDGRASRKRLAALTPHGEVEFEPDLAGRIAKVYERIVDLGMAIQVRKAPGKGGQFTRTLCTMTNSEGYLGKSRFLDILSSEEPADLGKIMQKLKANRPKE